MEVMAVEMKRWAGKVLGGGLGEGGHAQAVERVGESRMAP